VTLNTQPGQGGGIEENIKQKISYQVKMIATQATD